MYNYYVTLSRLEWYVSGFEDANSKLIYIFANAHGSAEKYQRDFCDSWQHPILWSIWHPAMFFIHYPMRDAVAASFFYVIS